jgi:glucose-6-phosphate-specific signal transduction histidine kinase
MTITINGQLLITKLFEMLMMGIPGAMPMMLNTDGLELMIPTCYKNKYLQICEEWEKLTKLALEHDEYKKMIIGDVNNYIAVPQNPEKEPKCKGRFEYKDLEKKKVAILHKNKSFLIIPKAIYAWFIDGIKPEDFIAQNKNISDYCGGVKAKGEWKMNALSIDKGELIEEEQQKICRYFICKDGVKLIKRHADGREIQVESGKWMQCVVNKMRPVSFDEINLDYYVENIYKEIHNIDKIIKRNFEQLELF